MLLTAACAEEAPSGGGAAGSATVDLEMARFGSTLWQIRGHHVVSLELYGASDPVGALAHAGHPIEEILSSIGPEVREADAGAADGLEQALEEVRNGVRDHVEVSDLETRVEDALTAVREAELAVVGDIASTPAYVGSVIGGLLETAGLEYEEAVPEGAAAVSLLVEYQDAYGFLRTAEDLYTQIEDDVERASAAEADEIADAFGRLEAALPGPQPPADLAPAEEVEAAAGQVGHELEEAVGAVPITEVDTEEVWGRIDTLLDEVRASYEEGRAEEAAELAAEAYLENYELVEGQVIEHAPKVNAELEPLLGAEIRSQIRAGVTAEELGQLIDQAKALLAQARQAVEGAEH